MAKKKVTKKTSAKKAGIPKGTAKEKKSSQPFPPKFSTKGVKIIGFTVEVYDYTPPVYED